MGVLKSYVRNQSIPEGYIVQGYAAEEVLEWSVNYIDPNNPIGMPKSHHEGRPVGVGVLGKMAITPDQKAYDQAHFLCCNK